MVIFRRTSGGALVCVVEERSRSPIERTVVQAASRSARRDSPVNGFRPDDLSCAWSSGSRRWDR